MSKNVYYNESIIGTFILGAVVRVISDTQYGMVGHVKGFSMNLYGNEIIVKVSLCNGIDASYHYCNLEVLK